MESFKIKKYEEKRFIGKSKFNNKLHSEYGKEWIYIA
ncbi:HYPOTHETICAL PROTEIN MCJ_002020 [Mesomycoplasma conjunctivae]|uniref:Uncharacterized protein n=1 Tax=Mesomycoplasma conjunctivae (strain ATCC 25834 / NCTC 10147 / HRC/581) TaxID=572263 RepID=C5J601_MESCH|nr:HYPOTHETICAL PROTEIN MCJ_002020 [Mesomycoplasma conjunctivae]